MTGNLCASMKCLGRRIDMYILDLQNRYSPKLGISGHFSTSHGSSHAPFFLYIYICEHHRPMSSEHAQIPHDAALKLTLDINIVLFLIKNVSKKQNKNTQIYIDYNIQKEANEVGKERMWKSKGRK